MFGLQDAPRLWTNKVHNVFEAENLLATHADNKLYLKHQRLAIMDDKDDALQLQLMTSAHMDDFKVTGPKTQLEWFWDMVRKHFGDDAKVEKKILSVVQKNK